MDMTNTTTTATTWANVQPGDRIEMANYPGEFLTVTSKARKAPKARGAGRVYIWTGSFGEPMRLCVDGAAPVTVERAGLAPAPVFGRDPATLPPGPLRDALLDEQARDRDLAVAADLAAHWSDL